MYISANNICIRFLVPALSSLFLIGCGDTGAPAPVVLESESYITPAGLVAPDAEWQTLAVGLVYTDGVAAEADGDVYFAELFAQQIHKITAAGEVSLFDESTAGTKGLIIGPDGLLYGCRNYDGQIVRYGVDGKIEVLLQGELSSIPDQKDKPGEFCNDIAIHPDGGLWFTDRVNERVIYLAKDGSTQVVAGGFRPNGVVLLMDRQMLVVTDTHKAVLHAFRIGQDGQLTELPDFFDPVRLPKLHEGKSLTPLGPEAPGSNGLTVDSDGRLYLASFYGIQVFSPDGRYLGVLEFPKQLYFISNVGFGGPDHHWLYATGRNGVVRIKMLVRGAGAQAAALHTN